MLIPSVLHPVQRDLRPRRTAPSVSAAMDDPHAILDQVVARGDVPFAIGLVAGPDGLLWGGAAGEAAPGVAAAPDTVLRLFSMTKAIGAVAAAMLVDRGQFGWDDPVGAAIPDFDALPVLDGWDGAAPRLRPQQGRATLRQLVTHTSGAAYQVWNADLDRFNADGLYPSPRRGERAGLKMPLAFDPGAGWAYGTGLDWVGQLVEAVDGRRVDGFVRDEILDPLGMRETVFEVPPALLARLAAARVRTSEGFAVVPAVPVSQPEFWGLGHCLTGTGQDYLRFLQMLLGGGALDGVRILSADMVETLMARQTGLLGPMASSDREASADVIRIGGGPTSHSLLGNRTERVLPGRRAAGTQSWAGLYNTHWWLDPARQRAGLFLTQLRPFWDARVMAALEAFERAVHDR